MISMMITKLAFYACTVLAQSMPVPLEGFACIYKEHTRTRKLVNMYPNYAFRTYIINQLHRMLQLWIQLLGSNMRRAT